MFKTYSYIIILHNRPMANNHSNSTQCVVDTLLPAT